MTAVLINNNIYVKTPINAVIDKNKFLHRINNQISTFDFFHGSAILSKDFSKTELLGRLYAAGFYLVEESQNGETYKFVCRKAGFARYSTEKQYGILLNQVRLGKNGKPFMAHKIRTMYPYAEFIQTYLIEKNNLNSIGKINNDFRIIKYGTFLRKYWIDEIPMLCNLFKGDIKLVGCRPITKNFSRLYKKELLQIRNSVKPGLIPCTYYRITNSFDDIVKLESEYLAEYKKSPILTDIKYLVTVLWNIIFKGFRSK